MPVPSFPLPAVFASSRSRPGPGPCPTRLEKRRGIRRRVFPPHTGGRAASQRNDWKKGAPEGHTQDASRPWFQGVLVISQDFVPLYPMNYPWIRRTIAAVTDGPMKRVFGVYRIVRRFDPVTHRSMAFYCIHPFPARRMRSLGRFPGCGRTSQRTDRIPLCILDAGLPEAHPRCPEMT